MNDDLGRLVRAAALSSRPATAKARFLAALAPVPARGPWPLAAAAVFLVGITLASVLRRPEASPPDVGRPAAQEPAWVSLLPLGSDGTIALRARLPAARAKAPSLRFEASAELPDRFVLMTTLEREEESFDGQRLSLRPQMVHGAFAQVLRGRFDLDMPWPRPGLLRLRATLDEQNQGPEVLAVLRGKYPVREWVFRGAAWGSALIEGLPSALDEIDALSGELVGLLKEFESACVAEERWRRESPRLKPAAQALRGRLERLENLSPLPAVMRSLLSAARNLDGDSVHFVWKKVEFQGPVSYHADQQKLKTFRGDAWTFANLRRYAEEAPAVAGREAALWIVKDLRRGGRPDVEILAKRPGIAPAADRLRAGTELDTLEEDLRAGR